MSLAARTGHSAQIRKLFESVNLFQRVKFRRQILPYSCHLSIISTGVYLETGSRNTHGISHVLGHDCSKAEYRDLPKLNTHFASLRIDIEDGPIIILQVRNERLDSQKHNNKYLTNKHKPCNLLHHVLRWPHWKSSSGCYYYQKENAQTHERFFRVKPQRV